MNELALFAGAGGGILGGHLLGWRTVCAVEWEAYPASVLVARQNDRHLEAFPIWNDVRTFDGNPWRGIAQVVSGGFPCQDISIAGKGDGLDGERSGMWREMARVVGEVRPQFVFVENSPMLVTRGLERVLGDLTQMGYDCKWTVMGAADVGAPHQRDRIWIVANSRHGWGRESETTIGGQNTQSEWEFDSDQIVRPSKKPAPLANSNTSRDATQRNDFDGNKQTLIQKWNNESFLKFSGQSWWAVEPPVGRVVDGLANRMDRVKALGNGQVPLCAATAWRILSE